MVVSKRAVEVTRRQAFRLALQALDAALQAFAVDANLVDGGLADFPRAAKASEQRARLRAARVLIEEELAKC